MTRHFSIAVLILLAGVRVGFAQPPAGRDQPTVVAPTPGAVEQAPAASAQKKDKDADKKDADKKGEASSSAPADPGAATQADKERDDAVLDRTQPDFTLVNLPTTLRLPKYKSAFRVTHRFTRALGEGDFGNLLENFFGFDSGALIGLEYRFGIMTGTQVGINRTSDRTIQFFADHSLKTQSASFPVGLTVHVSMDGTNNFRDKYSPSLGLIASRSIGTRVAAYVEPIWVNNSNPDPSEIVDDNSTFMIGLGARVRVGASTYLVGEVVPRVAGFEPGTNAMSFAIEKRAGGHSFQMNFSNSFGTTMAPIARGSLTNDNWYIGFNISRKFF